MARRWGQRWNTLSLIFLSSDDTASYHAETNSDYQANGCPHNRARWPADGSCFCPLRHQTDNAPRHGASDRKPGDALPHGTMLALSNRQAPKRLFVVASLDLLLREFKGIRWRRGRTSGVYRDPAARVAGGLRGPAHRCEWLHAERRRKHAGAGFVGPGYLGTAAGWRRPCVG